MTAYRCYFLGEDGKIKNAEVIECPTDAAALQEAEQKLATSQYPTIEVWDKARRLGMVGRLKDQLEPTAQSPAASIDPCIHNASPPDAPHQRQPGAALSNQN